MSDEIGDLRHRVRLYKTADDDDNMGGRKLGFEFVAEVWAKVDTADAIERNRADQLQTKWDVRVKIRGRDDVDAGWKIEHQGRVLKVVSFRHLKDKPQTFTVLYCTEEHPD